MMLNPDQQTVLHNPEKERFEIHLSDDQAVLEYQIEGDTIYFLHTGVPVEYEGQGIAGRLARAGLDFARQQGYRIVAECSYVEAYLRRHPEYLA
jgi:predicted GNAT family acetyltransferase